MRLLTNHREDVSLVCKAQTYPSDKRVRTTVLDSRRILRLLIRLGDLPVAVHHLHEQPAGQEDEQHVHHDLRVERGGVFTGCGAQTITGGVYSAHVPVSESCFSVCLAEQGTLYLFRCM